MQLLCTLGWNVKWYNQFGKHFGSEIKSETLLSFDPAFPLFLQEKWKHISTKRLVQECFIFNSETQEATQMSINRQLDNQIVVYCICLGSPEKHN